MSPGDFNNTYTFYDRDPADGLDRLAGTRVVSGSTTLRQTTYRYPDTRTVVQKSDVATAGDLAAQTVALYDGLGRPTTQRTYESASAYIETTTAYDALGRVASQTNPSRPGDGLGFATQYAYDALGRPVSVTHQDGTIATNSYSGTLLTSQDEVGATKQIRYDWAGRIFSVVEDPAGLNYATNYRYDALDNLTLVSQGYCPDCQGRTFVYDGLSRLRSAANPESGTATYTYDPSGNPASRTDARQITTNYAYDAVNRVKTKVSDDGSVNVSWTYDGGTYGVGRLTSVISPAGDTSYGYDAQGRVMASNQTGAGNSYSFGYSYNATGALTGETYPSGRVVTQAYDLVNRVTGFAGLKNGASTNYAAVRAYQPHGGVSGFSYANGLVTEQTYDRRLRPNSDYAAFYNSPDRFVLIEDRVWSGSGHVQSSNLYEGGSGPFATLGHFTQSYSHDGINRLTGVSDSGGYSRTFGYDQYGNLSVTGSNGVPWSGLTPYSGDGSNPFSAGNNRLNAGGYDAAGNQTVLGSLQIGYDAENRQRLTQDGSDVAGYSYDGNGNRVGTGGPTIGATVYVYDAFGRLAAEYRDGAAAAARCQTCYLTTDYLGSVRAVTSETLQVVGRHDYLPFGEEIPANTAGRDGNFGGFENVRQRFTGQERDDTNLDYFHARYYGGALGRFTSPDPLNAGADLLNPQSWNAYSYVVNRPLTYIDPQGTSFLNALGDFFSGLGGGIASGLGFGTQSCGADFCTTGTGHADVNPVDIFSGGGLVFGGGGLSNSGGRGGSGMPNFTTTGYGKADVPTVSTPARNPTPTRNVARPD